MVLQLILIKYFGYVLRLLLFGLHRGIFKQIKKPSDDHRAMLLKHDNDLKEHEELFAKDNRRLITLEDGYRKMLEWQTEQHRINMENEKTI